MRRLRINHAQGRVPGLPVLAPGLALLAGLAVLFAGYQQRMAGNADLQTQLEARQALVTPAAMHTPGNKVIVNPALAAEISEAQSAIHVPWIPLLQALEQAHQPDLYWMQLAPDMKRKQVRMTVLAQHRQQGWALVERLKHQPGLADVRLKSSEASDINGLAMTTLHLEAAWKY